MMGNKPYPAEAAGSKLGHNQSESEESAPHRPSEKPRTLQTRTGTERVAHL